MAGVIVAVMAANLQRFSQLFFCYAAALPCAGLIALLAGEGNPLNRWLSPRPLVLLGEASYSLYILHRPIHDWFAWMRTQWGLPSTETPTGFWLYLAACLALSVLSLKLVEYPCREWIKRRMDRRQVSARAAELTEPLKVSMVR
jgi:peptidoglycan/LPS O-acetylase OafA/YrhL